MDSGQKFKLRPNIYAKANAFLKYTFIWTVPIFAEGRKRDFSEEDLYPPLSEHDSAKLGSRLEQTWCDVQKKANEANKTPSLLKTLLLCFGKETLLCGVLLAITQLFITIFQPVFLGWLISYFRLVGGNSSDAYIYGALVVLASAATNLVAHPYMMAAMHVGMKIRVAACSLIYRKLLKLNRIAMKDTTPGQMVNLLSNDVNRFDLASIYFHYMWLGPVQTLVISGMLVQYIGYIPTAFGVISILMYVPLQGYLGKKASKFRLRVAQRTDERVRLMNEVISAIQVIKMYAWEIPFRNVIKLSRKQEMQEIMKTNIIRGIMVSFTVFAMRLSIFITIVAYVTAGNVVDAEVVFIVTAYFNILRVTMTVFLPQGIVIMSEALVSVRRLQNVMLLPELENVSPSDTDATADIVINNASASWDPDLSDCTLTDLSLKIPSGRLVAIVGPVGAGKTSVLNLILKELCIKSGTIQVGGTVSYAAQEPWLFAGSVRQNILFGEPMDPVRYKDVVRVCALRTDLAMFPQGDRTIVGDKGASLSGGQKARIALARAIYRKADIYLLDDPLAAVDAHVGTHLFQECISTYLAGKTRILVTHQLQFLNNVDHIFILNNGKLIGDGTYEQLTKSNDLSALVGVVSQENIDDGTASLNQDADSVVSLNSLEHDSSRKSSITQSLVEAEVVQESESRVQGKISSKVFSAYLRAAGSFFLTFFVFMAFLITQALASGGDYWITLWVKFEEFVYSDADNGTLYEKPWYNQWPPTRETCIYFYTAITVATVIVTLFRSYIFFFMCIRSSRRLHDNMFASITHATMKFFYENTSGRILNRFSKDMGAIDEVLPLSMIDAFQIGLTLLAVVILVSVLNYWLLIPVIVLAIITVWLRNIFIATSRSIKRLEGVTRSPVFSYMNATLNGLSTVRAFHMETKLIQEFDSHQDLHSSSWFIFLGLNRAFGYALDQLCLVFLAVVTFSFIFAESVGGIFGGDVGLAITQALSLSGMLQWGMRQEAEVENHMASVERVIEYSTLPAEPPLEAAPDKKPAKSWPDNGQIEFERVYLHYNADDPPVLKNLNFKIEPKEKIGIVGRTGAGKSSLISALFRLELIEGRIVIDGIDISSIGLHDLRKKVSIIPQDPVLFNGTMRKNLDPFEEYSDDALWSALQQVDLKGIVEEMGCGLQSLIQEGGANLSVGQRQLVCLARAIVRNNRILVLDEATANVDPQTDALIQTMIRDKFESCTVLTIAHRLHTIMDSSRVLVLDAGSVEEFDHPYVLLKNKTGLFYKMVQQIGGVAGKKLIDIAKQSYDKCKT